MAFGILVDAIAGSSGVTTESAEQDAALLWAALHGFVTLRASSPQLPWFADEQHVCGQLVARYVHGVTSA